MIFNGLIVSNICQDFIKKTNGTTFVHGNEHPTLKHHLKQPNRFECYTFTTCIGPRNHNNSVLFVQFYSLRPGFFVLSLVGKVEQWVVCITKEHLAFLIDFW